MLKAAQTLEDQQFEDPESQKLFCNVLHPFGTETYVFLLGDLENIAMKPNYPL